MTRYIYVAPLPARPQFQNSIDQDKRQRVRGNAILDADSGAAEPTGTDPSRGNLRGNYDGKYADLLAAELEELSQSSGYSALPYYDDQSDVELGGYYTIEDVSVGRKTPVSALSQELTGRLTRQGTRGDHYRAVRVKPREVTHPFGSDTTARVAIPSAAREPHWVNEVTDQAQLATPAKTGILAELGKLDQFQLGDSPYPEDETVLIYDIAHDAVGPVDVRVWDTRGFTSRNDANGIPQWQKVFASPHEFTGACVLSTGRIRVELDPSTSPGVAVSAFSETGGDVLGSDRAYGSGAYGGGIYTGPESGYDPVSLGDSDWTLQDFDLGHRPDQVVAPTRVDALTRWEGPNGTRYDLDLSLRRGEDVLLAARPPDVSTAIPSGLEDLLAPVADTSVVHPQAIQTIRPRGDVNIE